MNINKKNPLGRGIEALIPKSSSQVESQKIFELNLSSIIPNDMQPRRYFDEESLNLLAESIKDKGLMQPLVVVKKRDNYMLIAGERRYRAAKLIGIESIPVILIDQKSINSRLEWALIENTQREDLQPLELALAYSRLQQDCGYTQEELAKVAGKSRSAVANTLRLLDLHPFITTALSERVITEGHARVFLQLDEAESHELLDIVLTKGLSVRKTEDLARQMIACRNKHDKSDNPVNYIAEYESYISDISAYLGANVKFKGKSTIEIKYKSVEDLNRIVNKLRGEPC